MFSLSRISDDSGRCFPFPSVLPQNIWLNRIHIITAYSQASLNHCRTSSASHYSRDCEWISQFLPLSFKLPFWFHSGLCLTLFFSSLPNLNFCSFQLGSVPLPAVPPSLCCVSTLRVAFGCAASQHFIFIPLWGHNESIQFQQYKLQILERLRNKIFVGFFNLHGTVAVFL